MRAAQLDSNNYVINYAEVSGFGGSFIDPLNSVIGSHWNGTSFDNTPPDTGPTKEQQRAAIQAEIDALEQGSLLNRGSREFEIVSIQDLANRQAAILQPSQPDKTVDEIAAAILASRPYYPKLLALDAQCATLRAQMAAI